MSGGVDSSTVAAMLRAEGDVVGLTMQLWNQRRLRVRPDAAGSPRTLLFAWMMSARRRWQKTLGTLYYVVKSGRALRA